MGKNERIAPSNCGDTILSRCDEVNTRKKAEADCKKDDRPAEVGPYRIIQM